MSIDEIYNYDIVEVEASIKAMMNKRHYDAYMNGFYNYVSINCFASELLDSKHPIHYPDKPFIETIKSNKRYTELSQEDKDLIMRKKLMQWR